MSCARRHGSLAGVLVLIASLLAPSPSGAAEQDLLFRGRPAPECDWFLILQGGISGRVDHGSQANNYGNTAFMGDGGLMRNLGPHQAVGGNVFVTAGDHRTVVGFQARYRRWLSRKISLDFAPGVVVGSHENPYAMTHPGMAAQISMDRSDLVGVSTQLELMPVRDDRTGEKSTETAVYAGAHVGSYGTLGAAAAVGIAGLLILAKIAGSL